MESGVEPSPSSTSMSATWRRKSFDAFGDRTRLHCFETALGEQRVGDSKHARAHRFAFALVITSYSIHYTKLYDVTAPDPAVKDGRGAGRVAA